MLEAELGALAERVAPPVRGDLAELVSARLAGPPPRRLPRRRVAAAVAVSTSVAGLGLSPQVRAVAADLLDLAGIEVTGAEPDASPTPDEPLPEVRELDAVDWAAAEVSFPVSVPAVLGDPDEVTVADAGRVVSMRWRDGAVVLDQFDGTLEPVFQKQVGGLDPVEVDLGGRPAWWIPGPHDLLYVDRDGEVVSSTARLAGRTLIWEDGAGVTFRLEVADLGRREAVRIARSLTGTS